MSYQVLARKWRPRNFSTLVGQEHVVRALTHALTEQRLHHAYLFTGTRGVGKTTIARILAKSLNCETGITATPCGKCSACVEIDAGRFVDLLEVDAATNTRVDEMRQLLENAVYAPTRGRFKVYVIDEVHMLSNSAFNAMLKTLEEPPEHVKFILATTDPQKIPVTVLSRCLQFNLKQMPSVSIATHLTQILKAEGLPYEGNALGLIARSAAGSMRDALSLLDQAIAHGAGRVDEAQVRSMLGTVDQDFLYGILEALISGDAQVMLAIASDLSIRSISFAATLQDLAALLTRIQIVQCVPSAVDDDDPDRIRIGAIAAGLSAEFVQLAYQIVCHGRGELADAPDEYSGFVMTLLRLHSFRPASVADVLATLPGRKSPSAPPVSAKPAVSAAPTSSGPQQTAPEVRQADNQRTPHLGQNSALTAADQSWHEIVSALPLSGLARELAQNCELRQLSDAVCQLRLPASLGHLQMKPSPDRLQQALSEFLGRPLVVRIELGAVETETPAASAGRERQARQERARSAIEQDNFVRDVVEVFDASVIDSSIKPIV